MSFTQRILLEHLVKYIFFAIIVALIWETLRQGLVNVSRSGTLESLALIMSLVAIASITAYFTFSYTTVGKNSQRFFGYLCTFFLGLPILLSIIIIYFIASIQVPELSAVWLLIFSSLLIGIIIFDNLDLLRMGLDVSATTFFEKAGMEKYVGENSIGKITGALRQGYRFPYANSLIGQAVLELGKIKKNEALIVGAQWIIDNTAKGQKPIDDKITELFGDAKDATIRKLCSELKQGQSQHVADNLIATILERAQEV